MGKKVLIIGAGPAGLAAAQEASGLGAAVTLCGEERYLPYWRPRLTRYLSEPVEAEKLAIRKPEWFAQNNVELLTDMTAGHINPTLKTVLMKNGSEIHYDSLVLATGSSPNMPEVAGVSTALSLRSYDDAVKIRQAALKVGKAAVIGGGLLGLETTWELNSAGVKTALIERNQWLLPRQLNREGGLYLQHRLESSGIALITGRDPSSLQVYYEGACVILAAGVHANLPSVEGNGIAVNRAVIVNDHMGTSLEGIYACGDVAEYMGRSWGLLPVAQEQGRIAGINAAGFDATYIETPPSPMLKIGALSVFSVGDVSAGVGVVSLSEENEGGYACLMLKEDVLTGAVLIGNTAAGMKLKKAIGEKRKFASVKKINDVLMSI